MELPVCKLHQETFKNSIMRELTAKETKVLEEIIGNELDAFPFLVEKNKEKLRDKITEEVLFYIENELD